MKRIIRLTESDLTRIVKKVINEKRYLMEQDTFLDYNINSVNYGRDVKTPYFQGEGLDIFMRDNNGNGVYYQCVTDPAVEKGMKFRKLKHPDTGKLENIQLDTTPKGNMMDDNWKTLTYDNNGRIQGTLIKKGWEKFIPEWCESVYAWYNQEKAKLDAEATQIANAEAEKQKKSANAEKQRQIQSAINTGKLTKKVVNGQTRYYSTGKGAFTVGYFQHNLPAGTDLTDRISGSLK
jgi:hypothetical protein